MRNCVYAALFVSLVSLSCAAASSAASDSKSGGAGNPDLPIQFPTDVLTYNYNVFRLGSTLQETTLTPSNVNSANFGKVGFYPVDGKVDAQPLYVNKQFIGGAVVDVVYVVTENDSVYAFNAATGHQYWRVSVLGPSETPSDPRECYLILPTIGITATPVIDKGTAPFNDGAMYLVAMSVDSSGHHHQRLHALDLRTGAELFGGPADITATYPGIGGQAVFDPGQYVERAALLEYGEKIILSFASHCDYLPYTGWIMAYNARTLQQTSVLNVTPNGTEGAFWMAGSGPAADANGNIFIADGNGTFDTTLNAQGFPIDGDYGNAFLKLSISGGTLAVTDYFDMYNTVQESNGDQDFGSGGIIVLPDITDNQGQVHHLAVGAGKDTNIYVVNRDSMGKWNSNNNSNAYQVLDGALPTGIWSAPAYFNNTVYFGARNDHLRAFTFSNGLLSNSPTSQTANTFPYPGTFPLITSNQGSNGIVWAVANSSPAALYAYDATNLAHELYNSNQAPGGRDQFGPGNKFITPIVANGRVFVGTQNGVAVFGLLH